MLIFTHFYKYTIRQCSFCLLFKGFSATSADIYLILFTYNKTDGAAFAIRVL